MVFGKNLGLLAAALLLSSSAFATNTVYSTSFEASQSFPAGVYNAPTTIGTWNLNAGTAEVKATTAGDTPDSTTQYVLLSAGAEFDRSLAGLVPEGQQQVFLQGYFRGEGSSVTLRNDTYPTDEPASAIVHFSTKDGIQLLDGDRAGSGAVVNTGVPISGARGATTWLKVSVMLDFSDQTWDLFVSEQGAGGAESIIYTDTGLGFRDDITSLNGFRNLAEASSGFDAFRVVVPQRGDANGDSVLDTADLIAVREAELSGADDPVLGFNADVNGDGSVTSADRASLEARILNL